MNLLKLVRGDQADAPAQVGGVHPLAVNGEEFKRLVSESELPVVVDFWAEWCIPCHMLAPSVDQLAREYEGRAVVAKLNADEHPEILSHYGIMGIPTLLYFNGGREVDRVVGVNPYKALKARLERLVSA